MEVTHSDTHLTHVLVGAEDAETVAATMEMSPHLFQMFSSGLYSNQKLAVVREVMCNEWDAHIANGITEPIEIRYNSAEGTLSFRDFATGLSYDDMKKYYITYNMSSKRGDTAQTGGFGIGCKSPFAYVDTFSVDSCFKGTKSVYQLMKRSDDGSYLPCMKRIIEVPTEDHGLTVTIQLATGDWPIFQRYIREVAYKGDIPTRLIVDSAEPEELPMMGMNPDSGLAFFVVKPEFELAGLNIRVGNVVYPVPRVNELLNETARRMANNSKGYCYVLQAPGGTITMTPSREQLSMVESTAATINALADRSDLMIQNGCKTNKDGSNYAATLVAKKMIEKAQKKSTNNQWTTVISELIQSINYSMTPSDAVTIIGGSSTYPLRTKKDLIMYASLMSFNQKKYQTLLLLELIKMCPNAAGRLNSLRKALIRGDLRKWVAKEKNDHVKLAKLADVTARCMYYGKSASWSYGHLYTDSRNRIVNLPRVAAHLCAPLIVTNRLKGIADVAREVAEAAGSSYAYILRSTDKHWLSLVSLSSTLGRIVHVEYVEPEKKEKDAVTDKVAAPPVNTMNTVKKEGFPTLKSCMHKGEFIKPTNGVAYARVQKPDLIMAAHHRADSATFANEFTESQGMTLLVELAQASGLSIGVATSQKQYDFALSEGSQEISEYFNGVLMAALTPRMKELIQLHNYHACEKIFSKLGFDFYLEHVVGIAPTTPEEAHDLAIFVKLERVSYHSAHSMRNALREVSTLYQTPYKGKFAVELTSQVTQYFTTSTHGLKREAVEWLFLNFVKEGIWK